MGEMKSAPEAPHRAGISFVVLRLTTSMLLIFALGVMVLNVDHGEPSGSADPGEITLVAFDDSPAPHGFDRFVQPIVGCCGDGVRVYRRCVPPPRCRSVLATGRGPAPDRGDVAPRRSAAGPVEKSAQRTPFAFSVVGQPHLNRATSWLAASALTGSADANDVKSGLVAAVITPQADRKRKMRESGESS